MTKLIALTTLLAAVFAATAMAGNPDPRKCSYSTSRTQCGKDAAVLGLRRYISAKEGHPAGHGTPYWTAAITCTPKTSKLLLWGCTWKGAGGVYGTGAATVKFWATSAGWHTTVTLK